VTLCTTVSGTEANWLVELGPIELPPWKLWMLDDIIGSEPQAGRDAGRPGTEAFIANRIPFREEVREVQFQADEKREVCHCECEV
jgi:hypothetical protein